MCLKDLLGDHAQDTLFQKKWAQELVVLSSLSCGVLSAVLKEDDESLGVMVLFPDAYCAFRHFQPEVYTRLRS